MNTYKALKELKWARKEIEKLYSKLDILKITDKFIVKYDKYYDEICNTGELKDVYMDLVNKEYETLVSLSTEETEIYRNSLPDTYLDANWKEIYIPKTVLDKLGICINK